MFPRENWPHTHRAILPFLYSFHVSSEQQKKTLLSKLVSEQLKLGNQKKNLHLVAKTSQQVCVCVCGVYCKSSATTEIQKRFEQKSLGRTECTVQKMGYTQ